MSDSDRERQAREARESQSSGSYQRRRPITDSDLEAPPAPSTASEVVRRSTAPRTDPPSPRRSRYDEDPADPEEYLPAREPRPSRSSGSSRRRESAGRSGLDPQDEYVERVRRGSSRYQDDFEPASPSSRDPYDRLRRTSSRPQRRVDPDYEGDYYDEDDFEDFEGRPERRRGRSRGAGTMAAAAAGTASMRRMGSKLANPTDDQRAVFMGAIGVVGSLILLLILIAVRYGSAPDWIPVDMDAEGTVTLWGTKAAIWRLPIFALFSSIMALGLGWWLRAREPFAAEFLAVSALMIHGIIWVGVITLLW